MGNFFDYFFSCIKNENELINLINYLCKNNKVIVFGGFVRDYLFNGMYNYRDIDIVVDTDEENLLKESINKFINTASITINQFNGYKINFGKISVDMWTLKNTWGIKKGYFSEDRLLDTVYLNIDAYAYDLSSQSFVDDCDKNAKTDKIDICFETNPCEELNLIRCFVLSNKYKMKISELLKNKIINFVNSQTDKSKIEMLQLDHYGKVVVSLDELREVVNQWRDFYA